MGVTTRNEKVSVGVRTIETWSQHVMAYSFGEKVYFKIHNSVEFEMTRGDFEAFARHLIPDLLD